jgi:mannose-6-phosphate isomerase-like protein (cupin superfamily)
MTTILRAADAPQFDLPGVTFRAAAAPSRGSEQVCLWRLTVAAGHVGDQAHWLDRDEVFLVASGEVALGPDGPVLRAGDVAIVPAGEPIIARNPGTVPAEVVVAIGAGFTATMADGTKVGTPPWAL